MRCVLCRLLLSLPSRRKTSSTDWIPGLDASPFNRQLWGVALIDESGRLLYGRNENRLFIPASNTKLVVSAVASALLPPDWRVKTSLYGGPVVGGVLQGDLVLYGRGDPTMDRRCYATDTTLAGVCETDPFARLRQLVDSLRARGVRTSRRRHRRRRQLLRAHPGPSQLGSVRPELVVRGAGVRAGLHDNSVDFDWQPGAAVGSAGADHHDARSSAISAFENRTVTVAAGGESDIGDRFFRVPGTLQIWAEGTVALDHPPRTDSFALPIPICSPRRALRQALADAGIAVTGTTRSTTDSLLYARQRAGAPLAEVTSRPLRDWVFPILNTSQNWIAEMLLKQLGRQFGKAGSWTEGLEVERRFLIDSVRVDSTQFSLSDGSGLSSSNLVSPLAFTQLLRYIRRHPRYATFASGLPQSGLTGSLRNRFQGTPLAGRVKAKTGSISRVHSLSGYIELGARTLTFSIEANHHAQASRMMLATIDSLVVEMAKR